MYCPHCYRIIPDDSKHCSNCGEPLDVLTCIKCGQKLKRSDKACPKCGTAIPEYKEPPKKTVDWVWGNQNPDNHEGEDARDRQDSGTGTWSDFLHDMSEAFESGKDNWAEYRNRREFEKKEEKIRKQQEEKICPRCGCANFTYQPVAEYAPVGCFGFLILVSLLLWSPITFVVFAILFAFFRHASRTVTYKTCQSCGYRKQVIDWNADAAMLALVVLIIVTLLLVIFTA